MERPSQEELNRSGYGGASEDDRPFDGKKTPTTGGPTGPTPPENQPGHRPEHDPDKPVEKFRERAAGDQG